MNFAKKRNVRFARSLQILFSNTVRGVQFHDRYFGEFNGAAQVVRFQYPFASVRC